MELTFSAGTSFFTIESPDFIGATKESKNVNRMIARDVISFSVTEEVGKLVTGQLVLKDSSGIYSRVFRTGMKFYLAWGYKAWNTNASLLGAGATSSNGIRQGIRCLIQAPSGSGDESGATIYTVTFYGLEFLDTKKNRVFDRGTKRSMISQLLQELDVAVPIIDFPDMNTVLKTSNSVRQRENNFSFLTHIAKGYGASFQIGYKPNGTKTAVFVDIRKLDSSPVKKFLKDVTGAEAEKALYYNSGSLSNIQSYTWKQNIGENGQGDGASISYVGGKPVVTRFVVEGGSVVLWRLNTEKVRQYLQSQGNIADEAKAMANILNAKTFQEVKKFFDPVDTPFAPQGQGFTVNCNMVGDPRLTALTRIKFKSGFAAPLMQAESIDALIKFFIRRVTHTFNKQNYSTDLEICDTITLNGSYIAPASLEESIGGR